MGCRAIGLVAGAALLCQGMAVLLALWPELRRETAVPSWTAVLSTSWSDLRRRVSMPSLMDVLLALPSVWRREIAVPPASWPKRRQGMAVPLTASWMELRRGTAVLS